MHLVNHPMKVVMLPASRLGQPCVGCVAVAAAAALTPRQPTQEVLDSVPFPSLGFLFIFPSAPPTFLSESWAASFPPSVISTLYLSTVDAATIRLEQAFAVLDFNQSGVYSIIYSPAESGSKGRSVSCPTQVVSVQLPSTQWRWYVPINACISLNKPCGCACHPVAYYDSTSSCYILGLMPMLTYRSARHVTDVPYSQELPPTGTCQLPLPKRTVEMDGEAKRTGVRMLRIRIQIQPHIQIFFPQITMCWW
jgi:hypothetical protein